MIQRIVFLFCFLFLGSITLWAQAPEPPTIRYISQDPFTDLVTIAWYASISTNIKTFKIAEVKQLSPVPKAENPPIVTFDNYNKDGSYTFMLDNLQRPSNPRLTVDVDNSTGISNYHSLVQVNTTVSECPPQLNVTWSDYIGKSAKINKYTLYKIEGGASKKLTEITPSAPHSYTFTLTEEGAQNVCFYVETDITDSKGVTVKSTSGKSCGEVVMPRYPKYIRANYATVIDSHSIELSFSLDTAADLKHYQLMASDSIKGIYRPVNGGDFKKISSPALSFTDTSIDTNKKRRFYKLYLIDKCGNGVMSSNVASNMVLNLSEGDFMANILDWTAYHDFTQNVKIYHIYKTIDDGAPKLIGQTNELGEQLFFSETGENDAQQGSKFCYIIEAEENEGNFPAAKSFSNKTCIQRQDRAFVPDAINPYSAVDQNKIFKPSLAFISTKGYELKVIDRWGSIVFKTTDTQAGWDCKINNEIASPGTYIYQLQYSTATGKELIRKGTFNIIY